MNQHNLAAKIMLNTLHRNSEGLFLFVLKIHQIKYWKALQAPRSVSFSSKFHIWKSSPGKLFLIPMF